MEKRIEEMLVKILEGQEEIKIEVRDMKKKQDEFEVRLTNVDGKMTNFENKLTNIENKLDNLQNNTEVFEKVVLEEFNKTNENVISVKKDMSIVEQATAHNWADIAGIKNIMSRG